MSCIEYDLDSLPPGSLCRIVRLNAKGAIRQRLLDMGLLPDTYLEVIRSAPLGDPIELRVGERDSFIAIRRQEARDIHVCLCTNAGYVTEKENLVMR